MLKSFYFVLLSMFLLVLGTFISGTILTSYAQELGATWLQIGILSGSMYAVRLFIGAPVGRLADKKGILAVLKYSLLLYPIIAAAYYFSIHTYSLIGARLLHGVASAMMLPMGMAYVGQVSPKGMEGKYMGIYNAAMMLASGLGPFLSTLVADRYNERATFLVLFVLALISLMILLFSRKKYENEAQEQKGLLHNDSKSLKPKVLFKNAALMALSFTNIALSVIASLIGFFIIPFLKDKGMEFMLTGFFVAIYNVISGFLQLPIGKLTDKYNKYKIILLSGAGTAIALCLVPLSNRMITLCVAIILIAAGNAALLSGSSALSIMVGRRLGMGTTMGFLSTANSIGMILGCISLSLMPGNGDNYKRFFYFSGMAVIISILIFGILWPRKKLLYNVHERETI